MSCEGTLVRRHGPPRAGDRLEGELELDDALVLDGVDDEALKDAHARAGRSSCARRAPGEVKAALARPEVGGGARRPTAALLDLDLTELTYG